MPCAEDAPSSGRAITYGFYRGAAMYAAQIAEAIRNIFAYFFHACES